MTGYRSRFVNASGKRSLVFNRSAGFSDLPVIVPCGQCIGCRLEYSRQWAVRCVHEAQMHEYSSFITLTFSDEHLPSDRSICKRDFQLFMKRLRKRISRDYGIEVRYFACGEYGEERQRPHYHACIFGFDFPDKIPQGTNSQGDTLYSSSYLSKCWQFGFNIIGSVTFESCAYVARYICKKHKGKDSPDSYEIIDKDTGEVHFQEKEFCLMSRRPGIGSSWFEVYGSDTNKDFITLRGVTMKLPKFYDMMIQKKELSFGPVRPGFSEFDNRVQHRREEAYKHRDNCTNERLRIRETVKKAQLNFLKRNLE